MMIDQARVSLVAQGTGALNCELCTAETSVPSASVVIRHPRGGVIRLAACEWCAKALRRLSAATSGRAVFVHAADGGVPEPASRRTVPSGARPASPPVLVLEFADQVRDAADRSTYFARVYARARADGTWEGWLAFAAEASGSVLLTDQETTQSNREGVEYWASGLEPAYLQGALARARKDSPAAISA